MSGLFHQPHDVLVEIKTKLSQSSLNPTFNDYPYKKKPSPSLQDIVNYLSSNYARRG